MLTPVLHFVYFLMLLISYVNISIGLEPNARHTRRCTKAWKILYFLGIQPRLSVRQADALTVELNHAYAWFVLLNATY